MTQTGLGIALQVLGERESGTARLEEAVTAYEAALAAFVSSMSADHYVQVCRAGLDGAFTGLAQRRG
jgi:hypothetical protein